MNIYAEIRREVGAYNGVAVADGGAELTYQELFRLVDATAARLCALGIGRDFRVGVEVENSAGYIALSLAILSLDAVIVPVSVNVPAEETLEIVRRIELNALITSQPLPGVAGREFEVTPELKLQAAVFEGVPVAPLALGEGRQAAFIRFSSGTTGLSKGVVLSHRAVLERTAACTRLRIGEGETVLWVLDMAFHFVVTIILFLRRRALIAVARAPLERTMAETLRLRPVRLLYATPYHYRLMTGSPDFPPECLNSVKQAVSTAMRLTAAEAEAFTRKFNVPLTQAYGIIEVGLPCLNDDIAGERVDSVGRLQQAYRLRLDGAGPDGVGEILLRGPGMFDAYFSPFALRTELEPDGWFRTGDLGRVDSEGYLFIVGRAKNLINFMGMKIFPYEVETVLNAFPGVKESRVSGVETPGYGELPAAELVLEPGAEWSEEFRQRLRRHCFARLSGYKVPKEFAVVASIPRTASGKIVRKK